MSAQSIQGEQDDAVAGVWSARRRKNVRSPIVALCGSDDSAALQNPNNCFIDSDLRQGRAKTNSLGLPMCASGNFAAVFELQTPTVTCAVRPCPSTPVVDQQERYAALSGHLRGFSLSSLVGFEYMPEEIAIRGQLYPIVRMEWVDGVQLHGYVERHLKDARVLQSLRPNGAASSRD